MVCRTVRHSGGDRVLQGKHADFHTRFGLLDIQFFEHFFHLNQIARAGLHDQRVAAVIADHGYSWRQPASGLLGLCSRLAHSRRRGTGRAVEIADVRFRIHGRHVQQPEDLDPRFRCHRLIQLLDQVHRGGDVFQATDQQNGIRLHQGRDAQRALARLEHFAVNLRHQSRHRFTVGVFQRLDLNLRTSHLALLFDFIDDLLNPLDVTAVTTQDEDAEFRDEFDLYVTQQTDLFFAGCRTWAHWLGRLCGGILLVRGLLGLRVRGNLGSGRRSGR